MSQLEATRTELESAVAQLKTDLAKAESEMDSLGGQLAQEKMDKFEAHAALDAAKNQKPDTAEADALRQEIETLKKAHEDALFAANSKSAKASDDLKAGAGRPRHAAEGVRGLRAQRGGEAEDRRGRLQRHARLYVGAGRRGAEKMADAEKELEELADQLKVREAELAEAKVRARHAEPQAAPFPDRDTDMAP